MKKKNKKKKNKKNTKKRRRLCSEIRYIITLGRRKINGSEGFWVVPPRPSGTYNLEAR